MYVVPGNSGIPKGMAVKRKLSGTVVGVGKVWGARRAGSSLALGPHSCHLSPHLPLSTCPQQQEAQELEHITKGRVCDTPKFLESHEGHTEPQSRQFLCPEWEARPTVYFSPRDPAQCRPSSSPSTPTVSLACYDSVQLVKHYDCVKLCQPNKTKPSGIRAYSPVPPRGQCPAVYSYLSLKEKPRLRPEKYLPKASFYEHLTNSSSRVSVASRPFLEGPTIPALTCLLALWQARVFQSEHWASSTQKSTFLSFNYTRVMHDPSGYETRDCVVGQVKQHATHTYLSLLEKKIQKMGFIVRINDKTEIRKFSNKIVQLILCEIFIYNCNHPGKQFQSSYDLLP